MLLTLIVVDALVCGIAATLIYQHRGGDAKTGFIIGLVFGLLGVAYVAVADPRRRGAQTLWNPGVEAQRQLEDQPTSYRWEPPAE